MSERIQIREETYAALESLRGEDESVDNVIRRLLGERRVLALAGAGEWADSDAGEHARAARRELKEQIGGR
jgi:predicted CopG family antitoxin